MKHHWPFYLESIKRKGRTNWDKLPFIITGAPYENIAFKVDRLQIIVVAKKYIYVL